MIKLSCGVPYLCYLEKQCPWSCLVIDAFHRICVKFHFSRCEITRVLLLLILQPTAQRLPPDLAKVLEKYAWGEDGRVPGNYIRYTYCVSMCWKIFTWCVCVCVLHSPCCGSCWNSLNGHILDSHHHHHHHHGLKMFFACLWNVCSWRESIHLYFFC